MRHRLKPFINEKNRLKRLQFAQEWVSERSDKLGVVIWSDESMVRSHPFTRRHSSWVDKNDQAPLQEKHHSGKYCSGVHFYDGLWRISCRAGHHGRKEVQNDT
jgi:hypothetical protein